MTYTPISKEIFRFCGCELRPTIRSELLRYSINFAEMFQYFYKLFSRTSISCFEHRWPVGIPVDEDEIFHSFVIEVICTDQLKRILRMGEWCRRCTRLRWSHNVACLTLLSKSMHVLRNAWPEYRGFHSREH